MQSAEWFHVNFKAKQRKDDDGGDNEKVYFAEVVVFMFGYSPALCYVNACLPVDDDVSFGNSCRCLFRSCFVKHPSITAYNDDRLLIKPTSLYPIWFEAKEIFHELFRSRSMYFGKRCVWLDTNRKRPFIPFYMHEHAIDPIPCDRDRTTTSMKEAPTKYLYKSCKMSEDILMPKKRQGTNPEELQKLAVAMAKHIKNWRKPRLSPLTREYLKVLQECYRKKHEGLELEGVNDLIISEEPYKDGEWTRRAKWIHINFKAKIKNENGDGGVSEEQLYFSEVVYSYHYVTHIENYQMTVCAPVEKKHTEGKEASECGICKPDVQIYHPSQEDYGYIDDSSKMNPSLLDGWKEAEQLERK